MLQRWILPAGLLNLLRGAGNFGMRAT